MEQLLQKQSALELDTWRLTHACTALLSRTRSLTHDMRVAQDTIAQLQAQVKRQQQQMRALQGLIDQHPSWPPAQILKQYLWLEQEDLL